MPLKKPAAESGFSLLEVLIALLILSLILTTVSGGLSSFVSNSKTSESEQSLEQIQQALISHLVINGFLPCPDSDGDGLENRSGNQCSATYGRLPFLNLDGMGREDGFGNPFFYQINMDADTAAINSSCENASIFANPASTHPFHYLCQTPYRQYCHTNQTTAQTNCNNFCTSACTQITARTAPPYFNLLTPPIGTQSGSGGLIICSENTASCTSPSLAAANYVTRHVPVVFGSFGQNGAQTWASCNNANPKERENCDADRYLHLYPYAEDYDDQIKWLSMQQLKALMPNQLDWHLP